MKFTRNNTGTRNPRFCFTNNRGKIMNLILNPKPHLTHYEFKINGTPYRIIATEATVTNALHTIKNLKTKEIKVVDMYSLAKWFENVEK